MVTPDAGGLSASYFDRLYAENADPWGFAGRWYEQRKRALTMAVLTRPRFRRAFEPGCSIGLLTQELADRCDHVVASDISPAAVASAGERLAGRDGVEVTCGELPVDWPTGRFDLIVISEIAYYFDEPGALRLGRLAARSLADDGILVSCHWRHPVKDYPLTGDRAQQLVREGSGLQVAAHHRETDFVLEVLDHPAQPSVAAREGLTP